ncbi:hypothetical protein Poli38472_003199 [Pythium oligandrum]|uniref:Uncharacterized protein n=1 Tax=Pythium oligandrum TaxID=41045 RepID=A0A8K1C6D3_PYTOL|nr:hypothetical protein Poli38472_003199 [Pythium oligandrum]|eukprot:TMW57274.1 hypothetical protein Poli38472_003199 [Pythium oligandrum]
MHLGRVSRRRQVDVDLRDGILSVRGAQEYVMLCRKIDKSRVAVLFMGYTDQQPVYFDHAVCDTVTAVEIFRELAAQYGYSKVWLLLDGFRYKHIPDGLSYRMLTTSQQVGLKWWDVAHVYLILLSNWRKEDLFKMGEAIHAYKDTDMEERYYYSGGSVHEFALPTVEMIRLCMSGDVDTVRDGTDTRNEQYDRLQRKVILKDTDCAEALISSKYDRVIDSAYALRALNVLCKYADFEFTLNWSRGNLNLVGITTYALKAWVHFLAPRKRLDIYVSPDISSVHVKSKRLNIRTEGFDWSHATDGYEHRLKQWRNNATLT